MLSILNEKLFIEKLDLLLGLVSTILNTKNADNSFLLSYVGSKSSKKNMNRKTAICEITLIMDKPAHLNHQLFYARQYTRVLFQAKNYLS